MCIRDSLCIQNIGFIVVVPLRCGNADKQAHAAMWTFQSGRITSPYFLPAGPSRPRPATRRCPLWTPDGIGSAQLRCCRCGCCLPCQVLSAGEWSRLKTDTVAVFAQGCPFSGTYGNLKMSRNSGKVGKRPKFGERSGNLWLVREIWLWQHNRIAPVLYSYFVFVRDVHREFGLIAISSRKVREKSETFFVWRMVTLICVLD